MNSISNLLNDNESIIIAGIFTIVGLLIGSFLTGYRELIAYRRSRLEGFVSTIADLKSIRQKRHIKLIYLLEKNLPASTYFGEIDDEFVELSDKTSSLHVMINLHGSELISSSIAYVEANFAYLDEFSNTIDNLYDPNNLNNKDELIKNIYSYHKVVNESESKLISEISSEIYSDSILKRFIKSLHGTFKWPSN